MAADLVIARGHVYGAVLRLERTTQGLNQHEVAKRAGAAQSSVSCAEGGQLTRQAITWRKVCRALRLDEAEFERRANLVIAHLAFLGIRTPWYIPPGYTEAQIPVDPAFVHDAATYLLGESDG